MAACARRRVGVAAASGCVVWMPLRSESAGALAAQGCQGARQPGIPACGRIVATPEGRGADRITPLNTNSAIRYRKMPYEEVYFQRMKDENPEDDEGSEADNPS